MKKLLSFITALIISMCHIQVNVLAEESTNVTRAEMAEKIVSFYEEMENGVIDISDNSAKFNDITDSTLNSTIQKCYSMGFMVGTSENTFEPESYITRAQAAAIIDRMIKQMEKDHKVELILSIDDENFTDDDLIPEWAKQSAYEMKKQYFILGDENKKFNAYQIITEVQADSVLERIRSQKIENSDEYARKSFEKVFKFSLPESANIDEYFFRLWHTEIVDDDSPDLYDPIFIAKISFDKDSLGCFLKEFYFDVQTEEDIKELDDILITHKALDNYIQGIKSSHTWWDLPDLSSLAYKNHYMNRGEIFISIATNVFIEKKDDNTYCLYIVRKP